MMREWLGDLEIWSVLKAAADHCQDLLFLHWSWSGLLQLFFSSNSLLPSSLLPPFNQLQLGAKGIYCNSKPGSTPLHYLPVPSEPELQRHLCFHNMSLAAVFALYTTRIYFSSGTCVFIFMMVCRNVFPRLKAVLMLSVLRAYSLISERLSSDIIHHCYRQEVVQLEGEADTPSKSRCPSRQSI